MFCMGCGNRFYASGAVARTESPATRPEGLGDLAEEFFSYCGLTKETYLGLKGGLGLMTTCNCDTRKDWLNKFGEATGIGDAASKFSDWLLDRHRKANTRKPPST